ncbi:hypothetical protein JTE90_004550 [Oedothorax gibbosus]|uniref:Uncharacterized protein n=1 Tax=Oedothorax gibbosus TaxID=931172 RepID=A0AAV6VCE6_9ARAC|nr:hypothetical protein JTE90_004550 [Oedothorax gibbosus]
MEKNQLQRSLQNSHHYRAARTTELPPQRTVISTEQPTLENNLYAEKTALQNSHQYRITFTQKDSTTEQTSLQNNLYTEKTALQNSHHYRITFTQKRQHYRTAITTE